MKSKILPKIALFSVLSVALASGTTYQVEKDSANDIYYSAKYVSDPSTGQVSSLVTPYLKVEFFASLPDQNVTDGSQKTALPSTEDVNGCCLSVDLVYTTKDVFGNSNTSKTVAMSPESSAKYSTVISDGSNIAGIKYAFTYSTRDSKSQTTKDTTFIDTSSMATSSTNSSLPTLPGLESFDISNVTNSGLPSLPSLNSLGLPELPGLSNLTPTLPGTTTTTPEGTNSSTSVLNIKSADLTTIVSEGPTSNSAAFLSNTGSNVAQWCDLLARVVDVAQASNFKSVADLRSLSTTQSSLAPKLYRIALKSEASNPYTWQLPQFNYVSSSSDPNSVNVFYQLICSENGQNEVLSTVNTYEPNVKTTTTVLQVSKDKDYSLDLDNDVTLTISNVTGTEEPEANNENSVSSNTSIFPSLPGINTSGLGLPGAPNELIDPISGLLNSINSTTLSLPSSLVQSVSSLSLSATPHEMKVMAEDTVVTTNATLNSTDTSSSTEDKQYYSFKLNSKKEELSYGIIKYSINDVEQTSLQMSKKTTSTGDSSTSLLGPFASLSSILPFEPVNPFAALHVSISNKNGRNLRTMQLISAPSLSTSLPSLPTPNNLPGLTTTSDTSNSTTSSTSDTNSTTTTTATTNGTSTTTTSNTDSTTTTATTEDSEFDPYSATITAKGGDLVTFQIQYSTESSTTTTSKTYSFTLQ